MKTLIKLTCFTIALSLILPMTVWAEIEVSRITFCKDVVDLEPVEPAESFTSDVGKVYLFAEIKGADDSTLIKHIWYHEGERVTSVDIIVNGPRWRTYSFKTIPEGRTGKWGVEITDEQERVIKPIALEIK
ncbi:MAG: DUF2914 domain-containing protein [candidate division Zixibacteria bacterium]|nr:DUF2914 domain-containing protein [candidate division Zixibacteria bacterium]